MTIKERISRVFGKKKEEPKKPKFKVKGWHAITFLLGVNALTGALASKKEVKNYYRKLKKPTWSPGAWVFGPVWLLNSIFHVSSNVRLLNKPDYPNRDALLTLQGLMWLNYATFNTVFARLKSPILGLIWTESYKLMSVASYALAKQGKDPKVYSAFVPLTLWTTYASSLAWYNAFHNKDKFFGKKGTVQKGKMKVVHVGSKLKKAA